MVVSSTDGTGGIGGGGGGGREGGRAIGVAARWEPGLNSRGGVLPRIDACDDMEETEGRRGSGMLGGGERGGIRGEPEFGAGTIGTRSVDDTGIEGCAELGGLGVDGEASFCEDFGGAVETDEAD